MKIFPSGIKLFHADTDERTDIMKVVNACDKLK